MITRIKAFLVALGVFGLVAAPLATAPVFAVGGIQNNLKCGINLEVGKECTAAPDGDATTNFNGKLKSIVDFFSALVGFIAVIMIIYGGVRYITSGGDTNKIGGAKNTIIYAVIGLVIVALAQILVQFVVSKATE